MGKRTILYIIILSTISPLGVIISQTWWVRNALDLADQQHSHRVDIALENVLEEMVGKLDSAEVSNRLNNGKGEPLHLFEVLDTVFLRELLYKYVDYHKLDKNFSYAIIKTSNDSVYFASGSVPENTKNIITHKACLYCLWKKDYYHLQLYFPDIRKHELVKMSAWLITSGIFLIVIILTFYFTSSCLRISGKYN
jgi:two-component system phosphate regulon sensor histidine kinase PhoR